MDVSEHDKAREIASKTDCALRLRSIAKQRMIDAWNRLERQWSRDSNFVLERSEVAELQATARILFMSAVWPNITDFDESSRFGRDIKLPSMHRKADDMK